MKHDQKIKFALIGCGAIANKHMIALNRLDNAEVVGAFDLDYGAAKALGAKYSISPFANIEEMVNKTSPDVFDILTPSGIHAENVLDLIRFNKHFVVIHAGNLFHTRNPEVLFRGLSLAASLSSSFSTHARFIFYGVFDSNKFDKMCNNLGINSIVSFKPRIPQKQLFPLLKQASALLLINTHVPGHQIFIPAKFFDYLNAGRPIICLSKIGALSQIMSKTQSGVIVDPKNPVQIAREILKMYDQIYVSKSSFLIDQKNIAEYESLQTTKLFVDICNKVVSGCHTEIS